MTLDRELRSAFDEAAGAQPVPAPDLVALVRGGRARQRRRNRGRVGTAAAAVLLGAGGWALLALGPTSRPDVIAPPPAPPSSRVPSDAPDREPLDAGTHRRAVGTSRDGEPLEADLTVDGDNWSSGDFPVATEAYGTTYGGVGVYQPRVLAAGNGCLFRPTTPAVGRTAHRVAEQLATLPRSTVLEPPTPSWAFGRASFHLRLRIDVRCEVGYYRVAETPVGDRGITYAAMGGTGKDVVIDFWVLRVAGTVVVVDQWTNVDASAALTEQVERARVSIDFVE